MVDRGYAIRCPHCAKWNVWRTTDPESVAANAAEFLDILEGLRKASEDGRPREYDHPKLMRCTHPRWSCPSSFEAVLFRSRDEMKVSLEKVPGEWPFRRDFRLYKADCRERWENQYWAVMFCTPPFDRMRDIDLESLMDRELLSRLIAGMSVEINSPLTIFGARVFEPIGQEPRVYWMPIEGYSREKRLTPPRFNELCASIRDAEMRTLVQEYEARDVNVDNCPIGFGENGQCADHENPACMCVPEADWDHCPAFIEERSKRGPCYSSDLQLIAKVVASVEQQCPFETATTHVCPAGFTELAFPIVVHDHLIGVAMAGQTYSDPCNIVDLNDLSIRYPVLADQIVDIEKAKSRLIDAESNARTADEHKFHLGYAEVDNRVQLLRVNIERIAEMANARYRDIRMRSETVFREELINYIQMSKDRVDFFGEPLQHILKRMARFWAFKAAFLTGYSSATGDISLIGLGRTTKEDKVSGSSHKKVGTTTLQYRQTHPICYAYHRGIQHNNLDPLLKDLLVIFERTASQDEYSVDSRDPLRDTHFFVLLPLHDAAYAFILSVRDEKGLSRLEREGKGDVSELCQEIMLRVCTEAVYGFADVWYREAKERAWREFSALASHRIGNEVSAVGMVLDDLGNELATEHHWDERLTIANECINRAKQMLRDQVMLTAEIRPNRRRVCLSDVLKKAVAGVLPQNGVLGLRETGCGTDVWVDPDLMEEAFRELSFNAARTGVEKLELRVEATKGDSETLISFQDNGPGIAEQDAKKLFMPYVTVKERGTGLGLATVRRIVEAHGGKIWLDKSQEGAKFVISLPAFSEKE